MTKFNKSLISHIVAGLMVVGLASGWAVTAKAQHDENQTLADSNNSKSQKIEKLSKDLTQARDTTDGCQSVISGLVDANSNLIDAIDALLDDNHWAAGDYIDEALSDMEISEGPLKVCFEGADSDA